MENELQKLHDEYVNLRFLKNWLLKERARNINNEIINEYLQKKYQAVCKKQIILKKQIAKLCERFN